MPIKQTVLEYTKFDDPEKLADMLAVLQFRGYITRNQCKTIVDVCRGKMPVVIKLDMRMPKEMIYLKVNDSMYRVNNRARLFIDLPDKV